MRAGLLAERYGRAQFGAISGTLALFLMMARALAPVGAGAMAAAVGGYEPVLWGVFAVASLSVLAMLGASRVGQPAPAAPGVDAQHGVRG